MKWLHHKLQGIFWGAVWGALLLGTVGAGTACGAGGFYMERPKLGLKAVFEDETVQRSLPGSETTTDNHDLLERLTLDTNGWVYHPNLMVYHLSFEPEWRQESFRVAPSGVGQDRTDDRDTSILAYDARTTFFREKPLSLELFANRSTRRIDLSDVQDMDMDTDSWGSRLKLTHGTLPVMVTFTHRKTDQTGFYDSDEDRDMLQASIRQNGRRSSSGLTIVDDDTKKTVRGVSATTDSTSHITNAEFSNTFSFTGDQRGRLDSLVYLSRARYNDLKMDTRQVTENFFWDYGKHLFTQYTARLSRYEAGDVKTEERALEALVTHRLADRLTTTLGAGATFDDFAEGGENRYASNLDLDYRRPFSWGSLGLGAAFDYTRTNRRGSGKVVPTEERIKMTTGEETLLAADNILVDSIVVTDTTGAVVYTENVDYRIDAVGNRVRISRSLLGAITEGQEVRVRYSYRVDGAYDDTRVGQEYRADLGVGSFLDLSLVHRRLDQTILSGSPPVDPAGDAENSVRIRVDVGCAETRLEYEAWDRKDGTSTVTRTVRELIHLRTSGSLTVDLSGDYGGRKYTDTNEAETFYSYGAEAGWYPEAWCRLSLIARRNGIYGDRQDMVYSEFSPRLQLTLGVWKASFVYRVMDQEDRDAANYLWRQRLYVVVSRALW